MQTTSTSQRPILWFLTFGFLGVGGLVFGCDAPTSVTDGARRAPTAGEESEGAEGKADDPGVAVSEEPPPVAADAGAGDGEGYVPPTDWSGGDLAREWQALLDAREVDYGAALRTVTLRLRGDVPTLEEVRALEEASSTREAYADAVDWLLEAPALQRQLLQYFRDTFKMGGGGLDSAPLFATQLALEDRSLTELFVATEGACPTRDPASGEIIAGDCDSGAPSRAGVLTNPDVQRHFFSNLGFRRVRWVQETFACSAFPAEVVATPQDVGGAAPYTAPWPFDSIAGAETGGRIDFLDTSSVTCANCHATMNHLAPLFAPFDESGRYSADGSFQVPLPSDGNPLTSMSDYLPEGEPTAWRFGVEAPDLAALGAALAEDRDVHRCTVARAVNWAFGKGDIVIERAGVPEPVLASHLEAYEAGGYRFRQLLRAIFTGDDFVRF